MGVCRMFVSMGDSMSLLLSGAVHHFVIVWGCVCVLSVCMSCVRFCGGVVEVLL